MILFVPIHLDALSLAKDQPVLNGKADFTRLPYFDGERDVNGDVAYISEELLSEPFQDQGLFLKAGIHLHWALPDALTKGTHTSAGTNFPDVPNRWLVIRSGPGVIKKQWVVESDYLYPKNHTIEQSGSVSYPVMPPPASGCPYRFLGRRVSWEAWKRKDPEAEYLNSLTAVGYGEPTFAAFYPNCHSVFGFHDDEYTNVVPDGLQYDVVGWYIDQEKDCLKKITGGSPTSTQSNEDRLESLKKEFKWTISSDDDMPEFPTETLCYTRLTFDQGANSQGNKSANVSNPTITVANTGTEALSAYLAHVLANAVDPNDRAAAILKSQIEDQLEALSFSSRLSNRQLDVGPKFQEARHEKGFSAVSGGTIWSVVPRSVKPQNTDAPSGTDTPANLPEQITLLKEMADTLNEANRLQQAFDQARENIESLRRQLFSDWYKYMLCAYPPDDARDSYPNIDEVRNFIELNGLEPLRNKIEATGNLTLQTDEEGNLTDVFTVSAGSLALQLGAALRALLEAVAQLNNSDDAAKTKIAYRIKQVPGPRYYQPNDPVVLLTGDAVTPSLGHGHDGRLRDDGLLECRLLPDKIENLTRGNISAITSKIDEIKRQCEQNKNDNVAFGVWTGQPWNPFLLEWEAEVFPIEDGSNLELSGAYKPGFINGNFVLKEDDVDFSVCDKKGSITKAANIYSGSSILTPHAGIQLQAQIEAYLKEQLLQDYYAAKKVPSFERGENYFSKNVKAILDWYQTDNCKAGDNSAICNIIRAYQKLTAPDFNSLSQSLGGFNEALLMHKQTMQLDVADPLAFDDYKSFADNVKAAVGQNIVSAPEPLNDFNPIRSGAFKLLRLRLADTFGQVRDIDCSEKAITTEQLKVNGSPHEMTLPTRLTQPARINFRWLSATSNAQEVNDHPAASPICGWLLPNKLDNSLMIYDDRGKALGSINQEDKWEAAPGSDAPIKAEAIPNLHLRKMVDYILDPEKKFLKNDTEKENFFSDFLTALDNAMENIEPENFAQHQDIALLMGSPIALVRAAVNLELQGLPAVHQGWNVFRQDLNRNQRDTNDFDRVEFPIRFGEYRQFNDGMVGYWEETAGGDYRDNFFYAPQSDGIRDDHIKTHQDDDSMTISQTVTGSSKILTILMDPRGSVHATSGILPVKAVSIPPDQYADALKAIEITFLSTPILTEPGKLRLPLPAEPGFQWSWLQKDKSAWSEITSPGIVRKQDFIDAFPDRQTIWESLLANGWIEPIAGTETATVVSRDDKKRKPDLGKELAPLVPQIESILDKAQIGAVNPVAAFSDQNILEGWLKLRSS